jgi:hypothetical protein
MMRSRFMLVTVILHLALPLCSGPIAIQSTALTRPFTIGMKE